MNTPSALRGLLLGTLTVLSAATPAASLPAISGILTLESRQDNFGWHISDSMVNVRSELIWRDLVIRQMSGTLDAAFGPYGSLAVTASSDDIADGHNQDTDYATSHRTNVISRTDNRAGGSGHAIDLSLRRGFDIASLRMEALAGYGEHQQRLLSFDGFQTLPAEAPFYGPFPGLHNTYKTRWRGPWAGIGAHWHVSSRLVFGLQAKLESHNYQADANWNLRSDFAHPVSFRHNANATGRSLEFLVDYEVLPGLLLRAFAKQFSRETRPGVDTTFFANGATDTYSLNRVTWESTSVGVGVIHHLGQRPYRPTP